ncbi:sulfate transporter family-domain-containing protein [Polychytrium aggregatum]|uniref:sulfate transporter family-domain-containing protein n=1 Tax=Polychytrium aggregatum TaxID=110093 RepID=UPI0022FF2584|nr:sulfate transporter family-domain-containing protein [Polychytrium aggregatum]KAI9193633.1 sulfate transporter family-domain-containing protein [Polychytrium aggregatum]
MARSKDAAAQAPIKAPEGYPDDVFDSQYTQIRKNAGSLTHNLGHNTVTYLKELFPVIDWLPRYNLSWFTGDLIAGVTVTGVIIPQALAYATLAGVPVQYGLYTGVAGMFFYFLFATSKDVTIGATAVLSQLLGQVIASINSDNKYSPISIAVIIAFFQGIIELVLGLLRLGIVVDFLPSSVISGFTTGAGLTVIIGQIPGLFGIQGVNTNDPSSLNILINTIKNASTLSNLDTAFGVSALVFLLLVKYTTLILARRFPKLAWLKWVSITRNLVALVVFTGISYAISKDAKNGKYPISLVKTVPAGLAGVAVPNLGDAGLVARAAQGLPAVLIIAIIEHISVAKSFGRINNYKVSPNQELVALGLVNLLGSFIGGIPSTGSFSRTAIKSASGVRSPFAGLITSVLVLIALYTITPALFWISKASLSALIIAAITELFAPPEVIKQLWDIQFTDFLSFWVALFVTVIFNIETGIEVSIGFALVILLYRIARPRIQPLVQHAGKWYSLGQSHGLETSQPPAGVLVFRPEESLTYPNASYITEKILDEAKERTRYGGVVTKHSNDKVWSDSTGLAKKTDLSGERPILRSLVVDLSSVNFVDATGIQALIDLRHELDRYAGHNVAIHFSRVKPALVRPINYFLQTTNSKKVVAAVGNTSGVADPEASQEHLWVPQDATRFIHKSISDAVSATVV